MPGSGNSDRFVYMWLRHPIDSATVYHYICWSGGGVDATFDTAIYNGLISKRVQRRRPICGRPFRGEEEENRGKILCQWCGFVSWVLLVTGQWTLMNLLLSSKDLFDRITDQSDVIDSRLGDNEFCGWASHLNSMASLSVVEIFIWLGQKKTGAANLLERRRSEADR